MSAHNATVDLTYRRWLGCFEHLDLAWPDKDTMFRLAFKVLFALHSAIILPDWLEAEHQSCLGSHTLSSTHSSTPTHFPAENFGLLPVHRTWPMPADTWTLAPIGASIVVISYRRASSVSLYDHFWLLMDVMRKSVRATRRASHAPSTWQLRHVMRTRWIDKGLGFLTPSASLCIVETFFEAVNYKEHTKWQARQQWYRPRTSRTGTRRPRARKRWTSSFTASVSRSVACGRKRDSCHKA